MVHIGEKIKARAKELRIGPSELGKKINTTKQNVSRIYSRASIDTVQLWELSKALKFNFFSYYELPDTIHPLKEALDSMKLENTKLRNELKTLKEKNELLNKVNSLLEGKKKK